MRGKRIVEVLNRYHEIDRIVIVKAENVYEIVGNDIKRYKDALERKNILGNKPGKEITKKLKDKIVEIEYYIGGLFSEKICNTFYNYFNYWHSGKLFCL